MNAMIHKIIRAIADAVGSAVTQPVKNFDSVAYRVAIPHSAEPQKSSRILLLMAMIMLLASFLTIANPARAQTVTALQDTTCAGTRSGATLNCSANDFTASATLENGPNSPTECLAGKPINVNVSLFITSNQSERYNIGFFVGQDNNDPRSTTGSCSVATFPTTTSPPSPWTNLDNNACGDFSGKNQTVTPLIQNAKILCTGDPTTGRVTLDYLLAYDNQRGSCSGPGDVKSGNLAKCNYQGAANIAISANDYLMTYGSVTLTKQTDPAGDPQSFSFTATGDVTTCSGTPTPTRCLVHRPANRLDNLPQQRFADIRPAKRLG